MRVVVRLVAVAVAVAALSAPASAAAAKKPSVTVVKKLLTKHYVGDSAVNYPTTRYDWRLVGKPRYGKSRRGRYWADGTPPNTRTTVFPVQARSRYTVCYPDGTVRQDQIRAKYVFFRDEFGDWTFRIKSEDRPVGKSVPGSCPI